MNEANNGIPDITPEDLLAEEATASDLHQLESVMGGFTSTTVFLNALKQVLIGLEAAPEADALGKFIPIMAEIESNAMNGTTTTLELQVDTSKTERLLRAIVELKS